MKKRSGELERIRENLRRAAAESAMTQEQIGLAMGFTKSGARQAVSRLLNPGIDYNPRLSTLVSFAKAVNRPLKELI
jgi:transcriptional regulator with XRE-family HTH domain